jgi:hypothetical protein
MRVRNRAANDAALYWGAAAVAGVALMSAVPVYRQWGRMAVAPYALAGAAAWLLARRGGDVRARWILAGALAAAVVMVPVALEIAWGPHAAPVQHAESETLITEEAARALLHGRDPYASAYLHGPLAAWPIGTKTHYPYLPLTLVFGLPRGASSASATDARVMFLAGALLTWGAATKVGRLTPDGGLRVLQALVILPTGALLLAGGGDDVAVAAVMVLAVAFVAADRPGWAGVAAGAAAAMKQLAWPLLPFVVMCAGRAGRGGRRRATLAAGAVLLAVVAPFALWDPARFYEDVIRFPLGYGKPKTFHPTPTPGVLLARAFPSLRGAIAVGAAVAITAVMVWLLARPGPWSARRVAVGAAVVIAVGTLLAPASRLGFVVYPAALAAWAAVSRTDRPSPPTLVSEPGGAALPVRA